MFNFFIVTQWLLLSIAVGIYAGNKGRSVAGFMTLSLLLSPLVGFAFAVIAENLSIPGQDMNYDTHKKCPFCAEVILKDAKKCKHCSTLLTYQ